jgi:hypothetical protein
MTVARFATGFVAALFVRFLGCAEPHAEAPEEGDCLQSQRRQTMNDFITSFVGLDVHKDSIAMGIALYLLYLLL